MQLQEAIRDIEKTRDTEEAYMYDLWALGKERASQQVMEAVRAYDYCLSLLRKVEL